MDTLLSLDEQHRLLAVLREIDPAGIPECRGKPRRKVIVSLHLRRVNATGEPPVHKATLINVSQNGLGLLSPHPFSSGDRFAVSLRFSDGGGWLVLCEVRNCHAVNASHWKVGAKFIDHVEDDRNHARIPADWTISA